MEARRMNDPATVKANRVRVATFALEAAQKREARLTKELAATRAAIARAQARLDWVSAMPIDDTTPTEGTT